MKLKRIMAIVLCFAMVLSTMSFNVFAEEGVTETTDTVVAKVGNAEFTDIQEAIKAAAPNGTVDIVDDIVVDEWVMIAEGLTISGDTLITLEIDGLTINGNGKTLTINSIESAGNGARLFYDATELNINNLTIKCAEAIGGGIGLKSGVISGVTFDGGTYGVMPQTGDVIIEDCTFKTDGSSIYFEEERDGLLVTECTFENPDTANIILLRGDIEFINNTIISGRTVNVVSGSPVVTGNNFGDVRFKVYNDATATIENNVINVLTFNDQSTVNSTFVNNNLSEEAESVLDSAVFPEDDTTGEGDSEEDIILINTAEDLIALRDAVNNGSNYAGKYVKLNADIDLSSVSNWTPIGDALYATTNYAPVDATKVFSGTFDGNNKTISNLKIERTVGGVDVQANLGLFGITGQDAVIKNLTITNVDIDTDGRNVGAVAGVTYYATLENITVNGDINIKGGNNVSAVGGMARHYPVTATNITVSGNDGSSITGNNIVGGIFAEIAPNGQSHTYENLSVENVAINGVGGVGGIVGLLTNGAISTVSVKDVELVGRTDYQGNAMGRIRLGAIAGLLGGSAATISDVEVENVTAKNLDDNNVVLPVVGANYDASSNATEAKIGDTYYATLAKAFAAAVEGDTVTLLCDIENVIEIPDGVALDTNGYRFGDSLTGMGTEEDPYLINNIDELVWFRDDVNGGNTYAGKYVKLTADIDLAGENWVAIGSATQEHGFMGNFDGQNHKIMNLTITDPALDSDGYAYAGLFGITEGIDKDNQNFIKNLTIENVDITTDGHIASAAIAYPYYTIVENVTVCGDIAINGGNYTAGILAYTRRCVNASNLTIEGNEGSYITGAQVVGGVISDIQMNGGLIAEYSDFNAEGLTISGDLNVGGISGIIASQTLNTCSVKNVTIDCDDNRKGIVAGSLGGVSTVSDATVENISGASALIGGTYNDGKSVEAKIGDTYYATLAKAFETAENGDTVTLLTDIEDVVEIPEGVTLVTNGYEFGEPVEVTTYEELVNALAKENANVIMMNDITGTATKGGYDLAGIVINAGDVLDGNGYKLTINGANGTWDCAVAMTGGTVKNLTVANGFRGIFMPGADGDVVIDNVKFENVIYTFNSDAGSTNYSVTIKNTTLNGWTSYSAVHKSVAFEDCTFGEGSGYAFLRPYQATTFTGCEFNEGFEFDTMQTAANTLEFNDCTYAGEELNTENATDMFYKGGSVVIDGEVLNIKRGTWGGIDWTLIEGTLTIAPAKGEPELNPNVNDGTTRYEVGVWRERVVYKNGEAASIGGAPYDMNAVKELIIEEGVTSIGSFTAQFPNLTGEVVIPSTVTYIGQEAFQKSPFTKLTFAEGGTDELCIAQGAFKNLIIEEVSLPEDRPVHLHAWVFNNCHNLKSATLPASVTKLSGTNHIDYFKNFEEHSNPTWTDASEIFAYNENLETITFGSEEIRDMFYAGGRNGTSKDYTVANVGLTTYSSFDEAWEKAQDGETVKLLKNVTLDKILTNNKKITLDLNGKTITGIDNTEKNFSLIDNRGELTITGNGKMTLTATVNSGWNRYSAVIANNPGGKLVIENGTFEHLGGTDMAYGIDNLTNGKGTYAETIINGGTIKSTYRGIRQFLNGVDADNILTVNGGTVEGANKSIWMQDPSKNSNTGKLTVADGATLNGDVYLFVTADSVEWPVEVSIAAGAVNGEVISANVPFGYEVVNENGIYGVKNYRSSGYKVTAVADKTEVRYNNGNPDIFAVEYIITGGNVIGGMAQFEYDNTLFICAEDADGDGVIKMNSNNLVTDADGKTLLKKLNFTVKANPEETTTYTFIAKYVQVVSDYDAAGSGTQDGFVENLVGFDVNVIAQYDVTLPADGSLAGNTYVDVNADYSVAINNFDENKIYTITYTMGGVENAVEVTKDNVVDGGFVIENVTGDIEFTEVTDMLNCEIVLLADVISGYTLVMVKDGVSVGYTYDGAEMYAVERYVGLTEVERDDDFVGNILNATSVRAILVEGGVTEEEARELIAVSNIASTAIEEDFDVNRNGVFYFNDAMTAHGCYKKQYDLAARMAWYLASDVNTDFVVDTSDYDDAVEAFWATLD